MLSFFKSQQPASVLAFILFYIIIKIPFFLLGKTIPVEGVQNLWNTIGLIADGNFAINFLLAQLCLLTQAFWFNYLFQKADYNETSSMIPALYFSMVTSLLPQFNQFSIYILIGFVLLAVFQTLLTITIKENARLDCFNLGVSGGILIIANAQFLFFIPFLFLMLYAIKPFRFNEYMMLFFGILFPLYTAVSISYLFDSDITINGFFITSFQFFRFNNDVFNAVNLIITATYLLMAFISLRGIMYSTGFKRRKNVNMLVFFFIGITLTVLFCNQLDEAVLSLLFIPISVFLTLFMLRLRNKKWSEIFNAIFVIVTFITNIVRVFK